MFAIDVKGARVFSLYSHLSFLLFFFFFSFFFSFSFFFFFFFFLVEVWERKVRDETLERVWRNEKSRFQSRTKRETGTERKVRRAGDDEGRGEKSVGNWNHALDRWNIGSFEFEEDG